MSAQTVSVPLDYPKICTACHQPKPATLEYFERKTDGRGALCAQCRLCRYAKKRTRERENVDAVNAKGRARLAWRSLDQRERAKAANRDWYMQKRYGITSEEYERFYKAQDGLCAMCGGPPYGKGGRFHVDHDHKTNRVRALLCHGCNIFLGIVEKNPDRPRLAQEYLSAHSLFPAGNLLYLPPHRTTVQTVPGQTPPVAKQSEPPL